MAQVPKLLSQVRDDVTNIRLSAANTSLWSIASSMADRVDRAINDAIIAYPFFVQATKSSIIFVSGGKPFGLPEHAENVLEVYAFHVSDATTRIQITEYKHAPTVNTSLVYVEIPEYALNNSMGKALPQYYITIDYEFRQTEIGKPMSLKASAGTSAASLSVAHPMDLQRYWPRSGYAAIEAMNLSTSNTQFEIVRYNAFTPQGISYIERGQMGTDPWGWNVGSDSIFIEPVLVIPPEAYAVLVLEAQANMYQYWVAHRTAYDQWAASSQMQQMDSTDILTLVATLRKQAQEKYLQLNKPVKKVPPKATQIVLERRKGVGV